MKKLITSLLLALCIACNTQKKEQITPTTNISATIKGLKDSTFVLLKTPAESGYTNIDSTYTKNQSFAFAFKNRNKEGNLYYIDIKRTGKPLFELKFWNDKHTVSILGNIDKKETIEVVNSDINTLIRDYDSIIGHYDQQITKILQTKDKKKINAAFKEAFQKIPKDQVRFLFKHSNNPFSLNEFYRFSKTISRDSLMLFYNSLSNNLKQTEKGKILSKYITNKKIELGHQFIDFSATTLSGKKIKLSDYKGKLILVDFWAYWCKWCHVQNQKEFSQLNKKYKNDLVIISYALDKEKQKWAQASKKDQIDWVNVSNLKGIKDPVAFRYGVSSLPHSFLIDRNGIIVKQFNGYEGNNIIEKDILRLLK